MKNLLTGAAQSVTDTNERVRKLFEDRPMETPTPRERQNRPRKSFAKAVDEEDEADDAPEAAAPEADEADPAPLNGDEPIPAEDDIEE